MPAPEIAPMANACPACQGRGFQWKQGKILSRRDGSEVAHTYTRGDACLKCYGSGIDSRLVMSLKGILWGAVCCLPLLALLWFIMQL